MISTLAAIGFDPQIRGILVVGTGVVVLFGSIWMILSTNSGVRLGTLIAFSGLFGWLTIMGAFWWIRGIGYVGDSVSWHVLDFNRGNISQSSVEEARKLPDPESLQGLGYQISLAGVGDVVELAEFTSELDPSSPDYVDATAEEFASLQARNTLRNESTTLSQVMSVAPNYVEESEETGTIPSLNGWEVMNTGDAGEAQATAGAAIVEHEGFDFDSQAEFRFLDAFRVGGKPRLDRDIDPSCTFCMDNLRRGWHWIANSARIKNPPEYAVVQLRSLDVGALIVEEGQAPRFPSVDEDAPVISVVMIRELGNLRFPPALITLGSLFIFVALCYMLHERDLAAMKRVEEFEAEA